MARSTAAVSRPTAPREVPAGLWYKDGGDRREPHNYVLLRKRTTAKATWYCAFVPIMAQTSGGLTLLIVCGIYDNPKAY